MKIEDSIKKPSALGVGTKQTPSAASQGAEKTTGSGATSSVNVSLSSQLQALSSTVANSSVFDSGKVNEIKAAIAEGRFQVNADKVAEGLMATVRDLIQRPKAS